MTTIARPHTRAAAAAIVRGIPGAVLSGIVPDEEHLEDGGYHVSIDDLRRHGNLGDYSNTRSLDKAPPVTVAGRANACAIDVSLGRAQMIKLYGNVERVWINRANDTRAKYINAINVWSGKAGVLPVRFNYQAGTRTNANRTHEWHGHGDWPRYYVDDAANTESANRAARAMVSVWLGQSHDAWLRQELLGAYAPKPPLPPLPTRPPVLPTPTPDEDDTMITANHRLPVAYGYDADGMVTDPAAIVSIGLPPAGQPTHGWGKNYVKPFLSIAADHVPAGTRIRVAIHNGDGWTVNIIDVKPDQGGRVNIPVPDPAPKKETGWNITIGRVTPPKPETGEPPAPAGSITIMTEMTRK